MQPAKPAIYEQRRYVKLHNYRRALHTVDQGRCVETCREILTKVGVEWIKNGSRSRARPQELNTRVPLQYPIIVNF